MKILSLENVTYTYPLAEKPAIKKLSFTIEKGKVYGIIGSNESGKTTLCNIIRGFVPELYKGKLEGEIFLKDRPLGTYSLAELAPIIGYSFQNPFTQISGVKDNVYEEIAYGMENLGVEREKMIQKVDELIGMFDLQELVDKNPFELSGGQKQRVAIASMLALDPEIIILDEPTSQLDPSSTTAIFDIIGLLKKQGKTIILVEHKIDLLAAYCDEVILMRNGEVEMLGETRKILTNPAVLSYGGQLPQITQYFIEKFGDKYDFETIKIPLTVEEAKSFIQEGRGA